MLFVHFVDAGLLRVDAADAVFMVICASAAEFSLTVCGREGHKHMASKDVQCRTNPLRRPPTTSSGPSPRGWC